MKRIALSLVAVAALLALTAPIVMADDNPPPTTMGGGCSGPGCK
jgi:hypothetical protein